MVPRGAARLSAAGVCLTRGSLSDISPSARGARWWQALNPAIYLVSILPGFGVWQLTGASGPALATLAVATFAVVLIQHGINLLNDAADWRLGADAEKWDSWVRVHDHDVDVTRRHGWLSFYAGTLLGFVTLAAIGRLWVFALALPLVILGYRYNSGVKPLSYTKSAEWVTGLCYAGVFGGLWLATLREANPATLLGSVAFGCLAVALLLSHQPPQIGSDRQAGKQSFAARYGEARTYRTIRALLLAFVAAWGTALIYGDASAVTLTVFLALSCLALALTCIKGFGPKHLLLSSAGLLVAVALVGRMIGAGSLY